MSRLTLLLIPCFLFAQDPISVSGNVQNALTGEPIGRVTVFPRSIVAGGGTQLTKTDAEGKFRFSPAAMPWWWLAALSACLTDLVVRQRDRACVRMFDRLIVW